jgi:peptide/nickel transport system ATP-binding protein
MNALPAPPTEPLLEIRNLTIRYREDERKVTAVRDVSFALKSGGSLAIVGESGSGKSSVVGAILNFLGPEAEISGAILFEGQDIAGLTPAQRRRMLGRRIGAVFQDPFTSLNPAIRIGRQIAEPMVQHLGLPLTEALRRAETALQEMGIDRASEVARAFPHQLSGGMKQRALIAAALAYWTSRRPLSTSQSRRRSCACCRASDATRALPSCSSATISVSFDGSVTTSR